MNGYSGVRVAATSGAWRTVLQGRRHVLRVRVKTSIAFRRREVSVAAAWVPDAAGDCRAVFIAKDTAPVRVRDADDAADGVVARKAGSQKTGVRGQPIAGSCVSGRLAEGAFLPRPPFFCKIFLGDRT